VALFALGAAVRALGFAGPRFFTTSGDHVRLAVQALGILQGTLPVHYLGHEYAGAAPAFPLAAWFALAGASPLALDVFCFGVGLAGLWTQEGTRSSGRRPAMPSSRDRTPIWTGSARC
jgi:hypothetical protein